MNVVRVGWTHVSSLSSEMVKTSWYEPLDSPETGDDMGPWYIQPYDTICTIQRSRGVRTKNFWLKTNIQPFGSNSSPQWEVTRLDAEKYPLKKKCLLQ